jgi:hypothetical protein
MTLKRRRSKKLLKNMVADLEETSEGILIAGKKYGGVANDVYYGRLREVITFYHELEDKGINIDLVILSSLYEIVEPYDTILPYWTRSGKLSITNIPNKIKNYIQSADKIILLIDSQYLFKFTNELSSLLKCKKIAIVSAGRASNALLITADLYLSVPGVARIGLNNKKILKKWISQ